MGGLGEEVGAVEEQVGDYYMDREALGEEWRGTFTFSQQPACTNTY